MAITTHYVPRDYPMFGRGNGTVEDTTSVLDAALEAGALFEVHRAGIPLPDGTVPLVEKGKYKDQPEVSQTYRVLPDGTQHRLAAAVGPGYPASNYLQLVQMAEDLFPGSCDRLEMFDGGRRLMFSQALGEPLDLGGGDTIQPNLLWIGSLDTSWASQAAGLAQRFFCRNQMPLADTVFRVKRTTNHDLRLFERGAVLAQVLDRFEVFAEQARTLRSISYGQVAFERLLDRLVPELEEGKVSTRAFNARNRQRAGIRYFWREEVDRVGDNAWAVYNAYQSWEFHRATKGDAERQAELVVDNNQPLTNKAARVLLGV